jgi:hypothetical protein
VPNAILAIKILADAKQASAAMDESGAKTSKWAGGLSKAAGVATVGLAAVGAVLVSGVKSAAEDAQGQALLAKALQNSAGATDKQVASTENWITKTSQATGVADDDLRPALGNLVRATGDVSKSQDAMALALDISAATGKDVTAVSAALAKGYGGQTTALGRLVPGMDKAILASGDMNAITDELARTTGGSAAAAADTAAGQYKILTNNLNETKEGIGAALLPVVGILADKMAGLSKIAQDNAGTLTILIGVVAGLAAIIVTVNAVTKAWTAIQAVAKAATAVWTGAQWLLNAALTANPIGLVVVAVAAFIAIIVIAYTQSATFRRIVDAAFQAVLDAARAAWSWIKSNWPLLLAVITGPIGLAVLVVARHWDQIQNGAQAVLGWFRSVWDSLRGILVAPFTAAWSVISGIIDRITSAVSSVTDLIRKIPVPKIPHIPGLNAAATGTTTGATATFRGVARAPAAARGTTGGGGVTVNVNGALDPEGVARQISRLLGAHEVRVGRAAVVAS